MVASIGGCDIECWFSGFVCQWPQARAEPAASRKPFMLIAIRQFFQSGRDETPLWPASLCPARGRGGRRFFMRRVFNRQRIAFFLFELLTENTRAA
jgi:hypothetical protein